MGFKKYKWYKVDGEAAAIDWTRGNVAEVVVNGKTICLGRFEDQWYGFAELCPHAGGPMLDGFIDGNCRVVCPVHSMRFSLKNGREASGDSYKIKTYPVEVREDGVYVGFEEGGLFKWL
ncbi:Rieske (2Fe-2S) protein [Puia sp.]|jgi:3-phenylpropionate/trans-cinnamate dioxygenase ferredoxin subunit|uniref:Rieske (2Fe-2S) protein n=1 Tax=Puia sp. TaxID=2045100 RepID=UPI002F407AE3